MRSVARKCATMPQMSWEFVDTLPRASMNSSPYHGASEPIVARRTRPTLLERLRLFWSSTPELPADQAPRLAVLTPNHLYVERMNGTRQRVPLDALRGRRVDGLRVVYGVLDGDDLALHTRAGCSVMAELDGRVEQTKEGALDPLTFWARRTLAVGLCAPVALVGTYFLNEYNIHELWAHLRVGRYAHEVVLGIGAGAGLWLGVLALLLTVPVRWRVDAVGVHRSHGVVPWLHYHDAPDTFEAVVVNERSVPGTLAYDVVLTRSDPAAREMRVRRFAVERHAPKTVMGDAMMFAKQLGRRLGLQARRGR